MIAGCRSEAPELDSNVIETYKEILRTHLNEDFTLGFVENPDWEPTYFGSLTPALSHQYVGTVDNFISRLQEEATEKIIATETLVFTDLPIVRNHNDMREHATKFLWLNSPITNLQYETFTDYLNSLKAKRRYKVKEALKQADELKYSFEHTSVLTTSDFIELHNFVTKNLKLRFCEANEDPLSNSDYVYALRQWLWFCAAAQHYYGYLQVVRSNNGIVAITFHIIKSSIFQYDLNLYFQGIVKDETCCTENIGAICLSSLIAHLINRKSRELPFVYFDPTCKTSLYESSVDTYKRLVVNTDCVKPMVLASPQLGFIQEEGIAPPYYIGEENRWYEWLSIHGEGV